MGIKDDIWADKIAIGRRDLNAERHWRCVSTDLDMRHGPKKIFCFGGNGTANTELANGMCKVVEQYLGEDANKFEIYGAYYRDKDKSPLSVAARVMFTLDKILVPLIADKDKFGNLQRLPLSEACHNVRDQVMFVNHCHGCRICHEISKEVKQTLSQFDEIMLDIGYTAQEAATIHRQLVVIDHNNPCADLGTTPVHSTTLYRCTQADERNQPVEYAVDSFGYYLATEEMQDSDLWCVDFSENERALIVPRISGYQKSEHNGAYWQVPWLDKFEAAQYEEIVFKAFFKELANSHYLIENWQQIEEKVMAKNDDLRGVLQPMKDDGDDFMADYRAYRHNVQKEFADAKEKVLQGKFTAQDGERISQEALFVHDDVGNNLLDVAVKKNDVAATSIVWQNMLEVMPLFEYGKDLKNIYKEYSNDILETKKKHQFYTMKALDTNDEKMFSALAQNSDALVGLDYSHAGAKTAFCAAKKFCEIDWHDEKISFGALDLIYGKNLEQLIKRCHQPDMNCAEMQKILPQLVTKRRQLINRQTDMIDALLQDFSTGRM